MENSPMLVGRGLTRVIGDLAEIGYDARWTIMGADDCGAPHRRKRIWILAYPNNTGLQGGEWQGSTKKKREPVGYVTERSCMGNTNNNGQSAAEITGSAGTRGNYSATRTDETCEDVADTKCQRQQGSRESWYASDPTEDCEGETDKSFYERVGKIWATEPGLGRTVDGLA